MANKSLIKGKYRSEIDGLRAFAVVAVIINHFNNDFLPSGYLGVDIFFVISGYVITSSLAGRKSKDFSDFISGFYERRIKRIIPALASFVLVAGLIICFFNPEPRFSLRTGFTSLFGLSNLYLLRQSTDYFAHTTSLNVFTHTWSLGVEEQFYFIFPFIIWFTGFGRQTNKGSRNLFISISLLVISSLIYFIYLHSSDQSAAYFLMPSRLWEMGSGCLLFLSHQKGGKTIAKLERISPFIVSIAIILVMFLPKSFAVPSTISIIILTSLLITSLREGKPLFNFFTKKGIVHIGLISYSLYLWHWGIIAISRWTIGIHWWSIPFQIGLIYFLSVFSYKYIETPLRKKEWSFSRLKSIIKGIFTLIISAIALFLVDTSLNGKLYLGNKGNRPNLINKLSLPIILDNQKDLFGGSDCYLESNSDVGKEIDLKKCSLGNFLTANKRVLIIGNSHSAAFANTFVNIFQNTDEYAFLLTSSYGASPVKEIPNFTSWDKANEYYWEKLIPSLINYLKEGDIVFSINDLNYDFKKGAPSRKPKLKLLEKGLTNFSKELKSKSIKLVFLHNLPYIRESGCDIRTSSKEWFNHFGTVCKIPNKNESYISRKPLSKTLKKLEKEKLITVIDLFDLFCPNNECSYFDKNGIRLYRDEVHPSLEASIMAAPKIKKVFDDL